jgi:hypothetical protein
MAPTGPGAVPAAAPGPAGWHAGPAAGARAGTPPTPPTPFPQMTPPLPPGLAVVQQTAQLFQGAAAMQARAQAMSDPQGQQALRQMAQAQQQMAQAQMMANVGQRGGMAGLRAGVAASYGSVSGVAGALGEFAGGAVGGPVGAAIGSAVASAAGGLVERLVNEVERTRAVANPSAYSTREKSDDLLRATVGGSLGGGDLQAATTRQAQARYFDEMRRQASSHLPEGMRPGLDFLLTGRLPGQRPPLMDFAGLPQSQTVGYEQAAVGLASAGANTSPLDAALLQQQLRNLAEAMGSHLPDINSNTKPDAFGWGRW